MFPYPPACGPRVPPPSGGPLRGCGCGSVPGPHALAWGSALWLWPMPVRAPRVPRSYAPVAPRGFVQWSPHRSSSGASPFGFGGVSVGRSLPSPWPPRASLGSFRPPGRLRARSRAERLLGHPEGVRSAEPSPLVLGLHASFPRHSTRALLRGLQPWRRAGPGDPFPVGVERAPPCGVEPGDLRGCGSAPERVRSHLRRVVPLVRRCPLRSLSLPCYRARCLPTLAVTGSSLSLLCLHFHWKVRLRRLRWLSSTESCDPGVSPLCSAGPNAPVLRARRGISLRSRRVGRRRHSAPSFRSLASARSVRTP